MLVSLFYLHSYEVKHQCVADLSGQGNSFLRVIPSGFSGLIYEESSPPCLTSIISPLIETFSLVPGLNYLVFTDANEGLFEY